MRWIWIDRIVQLEPGQWLVAIKQVSLAEEHLHDHFPATDARPAMPIMPASLIIEGMAQSAGILVGHAEGFREKVILAKIARASLDREAVPGSTLRYTATIKNITPQGAATAGIVELALPASPGSFEAIGTIDLMFSHIDQNMAGAAFPEHNFVFTAAFRTLLESSGIEGPAADA